MKNITLEDLLQKHFGLEGDLVSVDNSQDLKPSQWSLDGLKAYGRMIDFLFDLGEHVKLYINNRLGDEIIRLVDTFDEYECGAD